MATILVVDDRPVDRDLLMTLLGYAGHELLDGADGVAALSLVQTAHPDLVICDGAFTSEDEDLAMMLAGQLAVAYENATRYDVIQRYAAELEQQVADHEPARERTGDDASVCFGAATGRSIADDGLAAHLTPVRQARTAGDAAARCLTGRCG